MEKIRIIQNAATFVSDLTVAEIEVLQKQNPMALAIVEPNEHGGEDIVFSVSYKNTAFGSISDNKVEFVDKNAAGKACLTVLIPANLTDRTAYLYDKYAMACNLLKVVEKNAKKALANLTTSKEAFAETFIDLDSENTIAEALEMADANSIPDETEKEGGKK
jgi:hypothetical protein